MEKPNTRRILVIDDNNAIHEDFKKILANGSDNVKFTELRNNLFDTLSAKQEPIVHYNIDSAYQGEEGIRKVREAIDEGQPYSLAFVDMRMPPGWDGLETIEHIWKEDTKLHIVICTAYSDYSWEQIIEQIGYTDQLLILKKPFDNVEVSQLASALTEKWVLSDYARLKMSELEQMVETRTSEINLAQKELMIANKELMSAKNVAEKANRVKSQFLANMSHEIRTPLNGVIGFIDVLMEDSPTTRQEESLKIVKSSANHLLEIVNDILDISKIESQELKLENINFDLEILISDVLNTVKTKVDEGEIEILADMMDKDIPVTLFGDPTRLRQIIVNLMGNAVKFTKSGQIVMKVSIEKDSGNSVLLKFGVQDTGIGIAKTELDSIFHPFDQIDCSATRKFGGTGLGLSIANTLAKIMGGKMWVESEKGKGSTFSFTAKFKKAVFVEEKNKNIPIRAKELFGKQVLIVDDNRYALEIEVKLMGGLGMEPLAFEDARSAVIYLKRCKILPDICFIDMLMPGMSGIDFIREIRNDKRLSELTVITLTTNAVPGTARICEEAGFDGYFPKPIMRKPLLNVICTVLGKEGVYKQKKIVTQHSAKEDILRNTSILLIEDNKVNQKLVVKMLDKFGCKIDIASDGLIGVEKVKSGNYNLVLMDIQMPNLGGVGATSRIRKSGNKIPIIAMTANAMKGDRQVYLEAGMNDYFTKPIKKEELINMVEKWSINMSSMQY